MRILKLEATKVHDYLPISIEFNDDLTFLVGLNGSGKTSALRLLMALLTPNLGELASIKFSNAEVVVEDHGKETRVSAHRDSDGIELRISDQTESLRVSQPELEVFLEAKRREEHRNSFQDRWITSTTFQSIRRLSTPMFLGLDRRFMVPSSVEDDPDEIRRREYMARRYWQDESSQRDSAATAALIEVNYLVVTRMQQVRAAQERLDENLRAQFFTKAFEYKAGNIFTTPARTPTRDELDTYREQLSKIELTAEGVKIPVPAIRTALTHFFERMSKVVNALEKTAESKKKPKDNRRHGAKEAPDNDYIEWLINKPQADKILEHLTMLDEYIEARNELRTPITKFVSLVNKFLEQTKKKVEVTATGQLTVVLNGSFDPRPITALSSGERQLLVMLAHLSLNDRLDGSGIFIVDEPELSLHIDWQEKFVDAIREANPKAQLILATHSPAIILDRTESCRMINH